LLRRRLFQIVFAVSLLAGAGAALAEPKIGAGEKVVNDVSRELSGETGPLKAGDAIFRNETIRSGAESSAKLVFIDKSVARVMPGSTLILNEDVYEGPVEVAEAAAAAKARMQVTLTRGVFRFTTGALEKTAYRITTPTAEVGVSGTVLDFEASQTRTRVTLVEGRAIVCPRRPEATFEAQRRACAKSPGNGARCDCVSLDFPGATAVVVHTARGNRARASATPVNLAAACAGSSACLDVLSDRPAGFPAGGLCGH